jgi:hypothetical protein
MKQNANCKIQSLLTIFLNRFTLSYNFLSVCLHPELLL